MKKDNKNTMQKKQKKDYRLASASKESKSKGEKEVPVFEVPLHGHKLLNLVDPSHKRSKSNYNDKHHKSFSNYDSSNYNSGHPLTPGKIMIPKLQIVKSSIIDDIIKSTQKDCTLSDLSKLALKTQCDAIKQQNTTINDINNKFTYYVDKEEFEYEKNYRVNIDEVTEVSNMIVSKRLSKFDRTIKESVSEAYANIETLQGTDQNVNVKNELNNYNSAKSKKEIQRCQDDIVNLKNDILNQENFNRELIKKNENFELKFNSLGRYKTESKENVTNFFEDDIITRLEALQSVMNQFLTKEEVSDVVKNNMHDIIKENRIITESSEELTKLYGDMNSLKSEKELWADYLENIKSLEQKLLITEDIRTNLNSKKIVTNVEFKSVISQVTDSLNGLKSLFHSLKGNLDNWKEEFYKEVKMNSEKNDLKVTKMKEFTIGEFSIIKEECGSVVDRQLKLEQVQEGLRVVNQDSEKKIEDIAEYLDILKQEIKEVTKCTNILQNEDFGLISKSWNKCCDQESLFGQLKMKDQHSYDQQQLNKNEILGEIDSLRRLFEKDQFNNINMSETLKYELNKQVNEKMGSKADLDEVQMALNQVQKKLNMFVLKMKDEIVDDFYKKNSSRMEEKIITKLKRSSLPNCDEGYFPGFEGNSEQEDKDYMTEKVNKNFQISFSPNQLSALKEANLPNKLPGYPNLQKMLDSKLSIEEFENFLTLNKNSINELQVNIIEKVGEKDFLNYLGTKADVEDVNRVIQNITQQINGYLAVEQYKKDLSEQEAINESLCSENIIGRWSWKTGQLSSSGLIPWEFQVINTFSDNFIWKQDCFYIQIITGGFYIVQASIFPKSYNKKVKVDILINDNLVYQTVAQHQKHPNYTENSANTKKNDNEDNLDLCTRQDKFSMNFDGSNSYMNKNLRGCTINEIFIITDNSRISITCSDNCLSEGLICIKRLC